MRCQRIATTDADPWDPRSAERGMPAVSGVAHWHETRSARDPASGAPEDLRRRLVERHGERDGLVGRSWVQLANALT